MHPIDYEYAKAIEFDDELDRRKEKRTMTAKSHWYTSPDPPKFGEDLTAACGVIVRSAQPVLAVWDNESPDGIQRCPECNRKLLTQRYAAVIQSGQESREAQSA